MLIGGEAAWMMGVRIQPRPGQGNRKYICIRSIYLDNIYHRITRTREWDGGEGGLASVFFDLALFSCVEQITRNYVALKAK